MEGILSWPGLRLAAYARTHPEVSVSRVEGTWHAWKPEPGDPFSGEMAYGRTEDELLAKLAAPAT
jgi:hypothetical protein